MISKKIKNYFRILRNFVLFDYNTYKEFIMKKKIMKILMVLFMVFGIAFSIINFSADKTEASVGLRGSWVGGECMEPGADCDISSFHLAR
jgi:hypothetical protein